MNFRKILMAIITGLVIFASCVKLDNTFNNRIPINSKGEYAIVLSQSNQATKAVANSTSQWHYDDFSLYTWNSNNEVIMNPFTVVATGADSYDYDGVGTQTLQYFKNNADSYSFIGVIPTTDATLNNGSVTVGVESFVVDDNRVSGTLAADSPKEFLLAYANVEKANYGQTVTLPFKHANALLYIGFISDDANTQILNYTPDIPATSVPGTKTTEHAKMFDLLAEGKLVGWGLTVSQGDEHGEYRGYAGNYFNINPYLTGNSYITQERLAELMPLVNTQFIYTDENCNLVDKWEYGVDKKDKMFLKFADGVDATEFIAGNDAFWNNLTSAEKTALQNHHDSGCRIIRIERLADGKYFAWGESYGLVNNSTARDFKVINGGTIGKAASPGLNGIRVFSAQTDATDGYAHLAHTSTANATVSDALVFSNRVAVTNVIQYSLPTPTTVPVGTTEGDAVYSPTTFYLIPGDSGLTHFVVKVSYIYKGTTVYDVRVPLALPAAGLEQGKYYKYIINIKSTSNGTNNPGEANDEKDDIDIKDNPIHVTVTVTDYEEGHTEIVVI